MNPFKMVQLAVLGGVVALAIALYVLWGWYSDATDKINVLETQIQVSKDNVVLLNNLLIRERSTREAAQDALTDLRGEVPDVIYSQQLPPSIQGVLDRFHDDIRSKP